MLERIFLQIVQHFCLRLNEIVDDLVIWVSVTNVLAIRRKKISGNYSKMSSLLDLRSLEDMIGEKEV